MTSTDAEMAVERVRAHLAELEERNPGGVRARELRRALEGDSHRADALAVDGAEPHPAHRHDQTGTGR